MATLALGFVGEAIGVDIGGTILGVSAASIGGFIGSTIGSFIDNLLFITPQQGPRLGDLTVQTSTYGNAIPVIFGPEVRLAGNVIWSTGLKETRHHTKNKIGIVVGTTYTYSSSFAVCFADTHKRGPISRVLKVWANKKLVYDASVASGPLSEPVGAKSAALWSDMRIHRGTVDQLPDPGIEADKGVGNTPGYRRRFYMVWDDFQLADYGNRIPSIEVLVEAEEEIQYAAILTELSDMCGIDPNTISASSVQGSCRGYAIGSFSSGTAAVQPLALVANFDAAQVGGALRFCARGAGPVATIPLSQLSGYQAGQDRPEPLQWSRAPETGLPREASITFPDPDRDYQPNSQTARRQSGSAQSNLSRDLPVVIDVATARQLADRMLWEAWVGQAIAAAQTDDTWIGLEAGRVYAVSTPAGLEPVRLKTKTRGANGVIELELARDRAEVYQSTAQGVSAVIPPQTVNEPGPSALFLFDSPILQDADDNTGYYFVVDGEGPGWRGADVLRSDDGGTNYDEVAPIGRQGIIGTAEDALADGPVDVFDRANVVTITLDSDDDELESVTELDVLNGKNACWIGPADGSPGEVLQYVIAALVGPKTYELSTLLRGRLGTEWATDTHGSGDVFVRLDDGNLNRVDYAASDWNKARAFKAVSLLTAQADAVEVDFTNTGEGKRPLSPVHVRGDNSTGDLAITWVRRSRLAQPGLGGGPLPLGESTESYEIDLFDGATFLRTLVSTTPEVTYPAATSALDGLAPGDTVTVEVYQMSDVRGRGRPGIGRLTI